MDKNALKEFLQRKYESPEAFLENVIFPVFGEENYDSSGNYHYLHKHPEDINAAESAGIVDILVLGSLYVEGSQLDIFDITVNSKSQLANSRVGIQQLIRRIISTHSGAFMIFHYKTSDRWDWRFTFCHKGTNKFDSTDSKRYTFLLGPGQSCRTAAENFCKIRSKIASDGEFEMEDIIKAFDVEALSKEFFDKYKAQYEKFVNYMADPANGMRDDFIDTDFDHEGLEDEEILSREEKPLRDYVKKLLGRIVFLHFIQKKGWLGVPPNKNWGEGDPNFMIHLFQCASTEQKDYFLDSVLEPLFEKALNTNRSNDNDLFNTQVVGLPNNGVLKIPYLNGGLFEREASDEPDSVFPAEYFESLLNFFYQYNFTIDENDPNDAQVGIDPEMLGRIFENLLEDNKNNGTYYTPKEVVQYMCKKSLIRYLQTGIPQEHHDTIRAFVNSYETESLNKDLADTLDYKLRNIKVCDPAIGSGAFPMGLLKEIFFCRSFIEQFDNPASIKKEIIQNNIYGVDIEKGAVDIARLRFWLSIIVDEDSPNCLPNMDFKIMLGNSLVESFMGLDLSGIAETSKKKKKGEEFALTLEFDERDVLNNLHINLSRYYTESSHEKKKEIRSTINDLVRSYIGHCTSGREDIATALETLRIPNNQFFLWHTYFADVFRTAEERHSKGFDIVIANPPYIDSEKMVKLGMSPLRDDLRRRYPVLSGNWDIYMAFMAFGLSIGDICTFITPDKWLSKPFGLKFREKCMRRQACFITRAGSHIFDNATVDAIITMFDNTEHLLEINQFDENKSPVHITSIDANNLREPYLVDYLFSSNRALIEKLDLFPCHFIDYAASEGACATSDAYALKPFIGECPEFDPLVDYKIINTGTIGKFTSRWGNTHFTYLGSQFTYPVVSKKAFSENFGKTYVRRAESPKIVFKGLNLLDACLDLTGDILPGKTTMVICSDNTDDLKLLCGLLNTKLYLFYIKNKYLSSSYCGGITFSAEMIDYLPLPEIKDDTRQSIIDIVNSIIQQREHDFECNIDGELDELNKIVYNMYNLSPEEKDIING